MIAFRRITLLAIAVVCVITTPTSVSALSPDQKLLFVSGIEHFDLEESSQNNCTLFPITTNGGQTGGNVFSEAQLQQLNANRPTYEQAARQADIPWAMIAVIHIRENNLRRENPGNGQGIYQFVSGQGGPYPTGPVSDEEFLRQTILVADFIKNKAQSNLPNNRELGAANASTDAIKDTFFSYNGRANVYAQQAASLGYNPATQPFEGSPYVMNRADPQRDPAINPIGWGQVKIDFGPIEYPANNDYGAFVMYAALSGTGLGDCSNNVAAQVVRFAREELALGARESDGSYLKYTGGVQAPWCAYFISWIFNKAGKPFEGGSIAAVSAMRAYAVERNWYHPKTDSAFIPQPGDIVVYDENLDPFPSHVNIVVSYRAADGIITTIGGNEGDTIKEINSSRNLPAISGYIRIP